MLKFIDVSKIFRLYRKEITALDNVNIEIPKGAFCLLRGHSGSGKTTFLNLAGCLARPSRGEIFIMGKEVSRLGEHFLAPFRRRNIGIAFQQFNLIHGYSVLQNIWLPLVPEGVSEGKMEKRAREFLKLVDLAGMENAPVNLLSGGEQQRVAFARAMVNEPEIFIADEPTSNIDRETSSLILGCLRAMKSKGTTVVLASHDPVLLESDLVDMILEVKRGILSVKHDN